MGDLAESFNDIKKVSNKAKERKRDASWAKIIEIINGDPSNFYFKTIQEWHHSIYRKEDDYRIDFYPNSNSFHDVITGERGIIDHNNFLTLFPKELLIMKKKNNPVVKVILVGSFRDGGTRKYQDKEGTNYYTFPDINGVFDIFPKHKDAKRLNVELEIVDAL